MLPTQEMFSVCNVYYSVPILLQSIRDFAHSSFQFALQKGWPLYMRYVVVYSGIHDVLCVMD